MNFSLSLEGNDAEIILTAEEESKRVQLRATPIAYTPWSIVFRDFLRLLYWFPRADPVAEAVAGFFRDPFSLPDESDRETLFKLDPRASDSPLSAELYVWQPAFPKEPDLSIQESAAPHFLNLLALGLFHREEERFFIHSRDFENEELFQFHGEIRRIEDAVRGEGIGPFWLTDEIQRLLAVARAREMDLPDPSGISPLLLADAENKVLAVWEKIDYEELIRFLSGLERDWHARLSGAKANPDETLLALENWIFTLNLLGFMDRFLAGFLPTRLPNPVAPLIGFLVERFFITQWESEMWHRRKSTLEETYRKLIPFLTG